MRLMHLLLLTLSQLVCRISVCVEDEYARWGPWLRYLSVAVYRMQLRDILRNTVLVTIAGKQLGSGVHCRIPGRREGSGTPTSRVTYSGALYCRRDLEVPWNVLSAFCTRLMERAIRATRAIRAISVMISPTRFDFLSRRACALSSR